MTLVLVSGLVLAFSFGSLTKADLPRFRFSFGCVTCFIAETNPDVFPATANVGVLRKASRVQGSPALGI